MNRASSRWSSPMVHSIKPDQRVVLFQYHTRNQTGVHILEFRHSFPDVLFDCHYGTEEYFEAFRTRIDPMQNHMDDCLKYSFDTCCICDVLPTKRVLLATKYILNSSVSVVKNLTAAVCQLTECEKVAAAAMKAASQQLERQFEVIEVSLWPSPEFHRRSMHGIASNDNSSMHDEKGLTKPYENVPIVLRHDEDATPRGRHDIDTTPKKFTRHMRPVTSPEWLFGPVPEPKISVSTNPRTSLQNFNKTMDIIQAAREGPNARPRILHDKTKIDTLIKGADGPRVLKKARSIDLLDAIKSLRTPLKLRTNESRKKASKSSNLI